MGEPRRWSRGAGWGRHGSGQKTGAKAVEAWSKAADDAIVFFALGFGSRESRVARCSAGCVAIEERGRKRSAELLVTMAPR